MDVEEYLRTSFDGSDCEYLDGEVVERNMGERPHSAVQANLIELLRELRRDSKSLCFRRFVSGFIPAATASPTSPYGGTITSGTASRRFLRFWWSRFSRPKTVLSACTRRFRSTSRSESNGFGSSIPTSVALSVTPSQNPSGICAMSSNGESGRSRSLSIEHSIWIMTQLRCVKPVDSR